MAVQVPTPKIAVGGIAFSAYGTQATFSKKVAANDVTTWEASQNGFTAVTNGLASFSFDTTNFQDYAVGALEPWLRANIGSVQVVTVAPLWETAGNIAAIGYGMVGGYDFVNGNVGSVPTTPSMIAPGPSGFIGEGLVTQASATSITVTGNSTPVNVGAVAAGRTIYASVHCTSITAGSVTCQLQSSTTSGGAYTNRGSAGAAITASGGQVLSAAGAITDTWWRLSFTVVTGPCNILAAIAIV